MSCVKQLDALLAMPASLRLVLVGAPSRLRPSPLFLPSTNIRHYATKKRKGDIATVAAYSIPEFRTGTATEISPEELFKTASVPAHLKTPHVTVGLKYLFVQNDPKLFDGQPNFYNLKMNTRIPEICILGRSNVGKSSFINGLAHRYKKGLAHVSQKAGKTKAMMLYGFGPAPLPRDIAAQAGEHKGKEGIPQFSLYVVDMPGYGQNSLVAWGDNIKLYLEKRKCLKGAVVLIDAVVGPKDTDLQMFKMLRSMGLKTAIVLTKSDKAGLWINRVRRTCYILRDHIHNIQSEDVESNWPVEKDIYVTALHSKDREYGLSSMDISRLAVARLAGLVTDHRPESERNKKWSGKVISFDDLQYETKMDAPTTALEAEAENTSAEVQNTSPSNNAPGQTKQTSLFLDLERASAREHRAYPTMSRRHLRTLSDAQSILGLPSRTFVRNFHTSPTRSKALDQEIFDQLPSESRSTSKSKSRKAGGDMFVNFIDDLKSDNTRGNYARNVRDRHDNNQRQPSQVTRVKRIQQLQSLLADDTTRVQEVRGKRLSITGKRMQEEPRKKGAKGKAMPGDPNDWSALPHSPGRNNKGAAASDGVISPDAFKAMVMSSDGLGSGKSKGKSRGKKGKGNQAKAVKQPKPVDPFEAKFGQAFANPNLVSQRRSTF
ncbi:hypothetical protein F4781DRAFT_416302 [Annulohypoxylon bovei var. microspora]|nr:hypothetical protein F4781DRAFT_416302 [Annulohypoxylon bovei var. microspora]